MISCPNCGSQDYDTLSSTLQWVSGDKLTQQAECCECKATFEIEYIPIGTELLNVPEESEEYIEDYEEALVDE